MKLSLSLPDELVAATDEEAVRSGCSRSALAAIALDLLLQERLAARIRHYAAIDDDAHDPTIQLVTAHSRRRLTAES